MRLLEHLGLDRARPLGFGAQHLPLGDVVVPFDQRRNRTAPLYRQAIEVPHGRDDVAIVGVEQMRPFVAVAGEVNLTHAIRWHREDISLGVEAVIDRAHVDVVHVEEDPAVGPFGDRCEKLPLGHRRVREAEVARDVLEEDLLPESVLHRLHPLDDVLERLLGVRQREQVVRVVTANAAPAEVIGHPRGCDAIDERTQRVEVPVAQRIGRAERQGHPVQDHRTARARSLEHGQRPAAVDHEVLRDRLEPVHPRRAIEHPREMRRSQPDAVPQIGNAECHWVYFHRVEAGSPDDPASYPGTKRLYFSAITLPPAFLHSSALLMSTNPLPLHSFLPLQAFSAPLQLPLPLQALTPAHSTPPPVLSAARAMTLPASTRAAAAIAMSIPLRTAFVLPFIPASSLCWLWVSLHGHRASASQRSTSSTRLAAPRPRRLRPRRWR